MTEKEESELALFENYKDGTTVRWGQLFTSFCVKLLACIGNCRDSVRMSVNPITILLLREQLKHCLSIFNIVLYSGNETLTMITLKKEVTYMLSF